jgi:hypothetical protein
MLPRKVLVVDDDADIAHTTAAVLRTLGHNRSASRAAYGVERYQSGAFFSSAALFLPRCLPT